MVGSDEIELVKECLLRTDGKYMPRHGCGKLAENKIG